MRQTFKYHTECFLKTDCKCKEWYLVLAKCGLKVLERLHFGEFNTNLVAVEFHFEGLAIYCGKFALEFRDII